MQIGQDRLIPFYAKSRRCLSVVCIEIGQTVIDWSTVELSLWYVMSCFHLTIVDYWKRKIKCFINNNIFDVFVYICIFFYWNDMFFISISNFDSRYNYSSTLLMWQNQEDCLRARLRFPLKCPWSLKLGKLCTKHTMGFLSIFRYIDLF